MTINKMRNEVQEMINDGINPFMYFIYNKKHNLVWWLKYRAFLRYLDKLSPNYYMLLAICDFVKLIAIMFAYPNDSKESRIYAYSHLVNGVASFGINDINFKLEYTLYPGLNSEYEPNQIAITFTRLSDDGGVSTAIFNDGEAIIKTKEDALFIHNILEWTMNSIKELFIIYYKCAPKQQFKETSTPSAKDFIFKHHYKDGGIKMEKELSEKEIINEREYDSGIDRIAESFKKTTKVDLIFTNNLSLSELLELVEEESGEFFQAFHKYKRAAGIIGPSTSVKKEDAMSNVKEELCDLIFNIIQCMQKMQMFDDFDYWREIKSKKGKDEVCRDLRSIASK